MNNTILAIDLGKYKCVACLLDQNTGEFRFIAFDTSRAELHKLIGKEQPIVVIIEACLLAGRVHDLCGELGVRCLVANTASEAWKFKRQGVREKGPDTFSRSIRCSARFARLSCRCYCKSLNLASTAAAQWRR